MMSEVKRLQEIKNMDYGEKFDWGQPAEDNSFSDDENKILSDDQRLLQEVYEILYTEK